MRKPLIAVIPLWDAEKASQWMLPDYLAGIEKTGGLPAVLPLTADPDSIDAMAAAYDGFLFTGGQDISPALYGEQPAAYCGETCPERDTMEAGLFRRAVLDLGKPALFICRGIQLLNVLLGGSLYQDLPAQRPDSNLTHQQKPPYSQPVHDVRIVKGSPLHTLLKEETIAVNSCHHQGIKALSPRLTAMAGATDGLVEAAYMPDRHFVWGVQWHPELLFPEKRSALLFASFVAACRQVD